MTIDEITGWIKSEAEVQHSKSSGPGGQNVNKVNTRVTLSIPVGKMPLPDKDLIRLAERLAGRINAEGRMIISSGDTRSQLQNLRLAETRAAGLIAGAIARPKKRRKTKPTRGSIERRLSEKKHRANIKKNRSV
jgi:ribosome-associated protein